MYGSCYFLKLLTGTHVVFEVVGVAVLEAARSSGTAGAFRSCSWHGGLGHHLHGRSDRVPRTNGGRRSGAIIKKQSPVVVPVTACGRVTRIGILLGDRADLRRCAGDYPCAGFILVAGTAAVIIHPAIPGRAGAAQVVGAAIAAVQTAGTGDIGFGDVLLHAGAGGGVRGVIRPSCGDQVIGPSAGIDSDLAVHTAVVA